MPVAEQETLVLADEETQDPRIRPFAEGTAAVFSAKAPDKTGPNEDSVGLFSVGPGHGVLAVADGMGGQPGGDSASRLLILSLQRSIEARHDETSVRAAILDAVEQANQLVLELGVGAATTLAALEVLGPTVRPYHVGDSAILVVGQRGKVKLQTVPHSPVGYAVEAGLLDENEAMHHDERHLVSNIVGDRAMRIEVGMPLELAARDTVVIASDGLFDNLNPAEVADLVRIRPLDVVARELAAACRDRMSAPGGEHPSKPDDVTFVLYRRTRV